MLDFLDELMERFVRQEPLAVVIVLFVAFFVTSVIWRLFRISLLRARQAERDRLNARLGAVRLRIAEVRRDLRTGRRTPSPVRVPSEATMRCAFCDEEFPRSALVCGHCSRPNVERLAEFADVQKRLRKALADVRS